MRVNLYPAEKITQKPRREWTLFVFTQTEPQIMIQTWLSPVWMIKLPVIFLCNKGSRAYCANALLLNDLIREPHSKLEQKISTWRWARSSARKRHCDSRSCVNCCSSRQMWLTFLPISCFIKISWAPKNANCCLPILNDLRPLSGIVSF